MWYHVGMRLHLGMKRKSPIGKDRQHHVRISQRAYERLEACFKASTVKSRRQLLDNLISSCSIDMGVEPALEKHWRKAGRRKKAADGGR